MARPGPVLSLMQTDFNTSLSESAGRRDKHCAGINTPRHSAACNELHQAGFHHRALFAGDASIYFQEIGQSQQETNCQVQSKFPACTLWAGRGARLRRCGSPASPRPPLRLCLHTRPPAELRGWLDRKSCRGRGWHASARPRPSVHPEKLQGRRSAATASRKGTQLEGNAGPAPEPAPALGLSERLPQDPAPLPGVLGGPSRAVWSRLVAPQHGRAPGPRRPGRLCADPKNHVSKQLQTRGQRTQQQPRAGLRAVARIQEEAGAGGGGRGLPGRPGSGGTMVREAAAGTESTWPARALPRRLHVPDNGFPGNLRTSWRQPATSARGEPHRGRPPSPKYFPPASPPAQRRLRRRRGHQVPHEKRGVHAPRTAASPAPRASPARNNGPPPRKLPAPRVPAGRDPGTSLPAARAPAAARTAAPPRPRPRPGANQLHVLRARGWGQPAA
ncbi:PREDICTED: translation initiation factor IF-2-like, partial [Chinchilla lanigera]|uniref:translation initiation factor IF-2-like n=1 Tax=Chinchilla lanigera TaxID=34839 RepID=UPI000695E06E